MAEEDYKSVKGAAKAKTVPRIVMAAPAAAAVEPATQAALVVEPHPTAGAVPVQATPAETEAAPQTKKRGRPKGSRSKSSEATLPEGARRSLTIYFSQDQYRWLFRTAHARSGETEAHVSIAEVVRECVDKERKTHHA